MCFAHKTVKTEKVYSVHETQGEISEQPEEFHFPHHVDNPLLKTDLKTGILGFYYETKKCLFLVYLTVECKTFCYIMKLTPMKN